jgi:hypothetical protein
VEKAFFAIYKKLADAPGSSMHVRIESCCLSTSKPNTTISPIEKKKTLFNRMGVFLWMLD